MAWFGVTVLGALWCCLHAYCVTDQCTHDDPITAAELLFRQGLTSGDPEHFRLATMCNPSLAKAYNNLGATLGSGRVHEAIAAMDHALKLDPGLPGAALGRKRLLNAHVPAWHFSMMNDQSRNEAYREAIERAVRRAGPNAPVLDIGCGAGLLSMMAARAGSRHVTAVEATSLLAQMAQKVVGTNGYREQIHVVNKWSLDVGVDDLAGGKRASILVGEVVNTGLIGEGMLKSFNDAHDRLLGPNPTVIPRAAAVQAILIESNELLRHVHVDNADGFDLRAFNDFAPADYMQYELSHLDYRPLSDRFMPLVFDLRQKHRPGRTQSQVRVTRTGRAVAIAWWFLLELDEESSFSMSPEQGPSSYPHWKQAVQYLGFSLDVKSGDQLNITAAHDLQTITFSLND